MESFNSEQTNISCQGPPTGSAYLGILPDAVISCCQAAKLTVLVQLWACIKDLKGNQWKLISVASYSDSFEAQLAACKPLELQPLTVPLQPPGIAADLPLPQVENERMLLFVHDLRDIQGLLLCTCCCCLHCMLVSRQVNINTKQFPSI